MSVILPAAVILLVLLAGIYRLAVWARKHASQRSKDGAVVVLLAVICAGTFICFPVWFAVTLSIALMACVYADFYKRKERPGNVE